MAYAIDRAGGDLAAWEKALRGIKAGGGISCGVALDYLTRKRQYVEQIIVVTDEQENTAPYFVDSLEKYREAVKADPNVCFVRTPGASNYLEEQSRRAAVPCDAFQFTGDYYALPNLVPLLSRPSKLELLLEIMGHPLPTRKAVQYDWRTEFCCPTARAYKPRVEEWCRKAQFRSSWNLQQAPVLFWRRFIKETERPFLFFLPALAGSLVCHQL